MDMEPLLCWRNLLPEARIRIFHHGRTESGCWYHGDALLIRKLTSCYEYVHTFIIKLPGVVNKCCDEYVCPFNIKLSCVIDD